MILIVHTNYYQVEHAFWFWKTGEFVENKSFHFSAEKYNDKKEHKTGPDGKFVKVSIRRASLYLKSIQNLSGNAWVSIFEAARKVLDLGKKKMKGRSRSASSHASSDVLEESAPEFVLLSDDDYCF